MLLANKTLATGKWSKRGRVGNAAVRTCLFIALASAAPVGSSAQQLLDDFERAASTAVGGAWVESESSVPGGAQIINSGAAGILQLGSTTSGRDYVTQDVSGIFNTTYSTNSCLLTWAFCMRQSRTDPSGFTGTTYGSAFVLGASSANLIGAGVTGYAVVLGNTGGTDPLRLVRFANGLASDASLTNVISASGAPYSDLGNQYLAVRVTLDPVTGTWTMYASTIASLAAFSITNPATAATSLGSGVSNHHTGTNLLYCGPFWRHDVSPTDFALFDNVQIPQLCIPTVTFNSSTSSSPEGNAGTTDVPVGLSIFPATAGGTITVSMSYGAGVAYGTDFTIPVTGMVASVVGTDITLTVPAGTAASFIVRLNGDATDEGNEFITFTIVSGTSGMVPGTAATNVFTIVDEDGPPSVSFTTSLNTVLEGNSAIFNISISPTAPVATTVQIQITNGPGAGYGAPYSVGSGYDYFTPTIAGFVMVNIPANTATANFSVATYLDGIVDTPSPGIETITFTILSASGAVVAAAPQNTARLNISDTQALPMVLSPGDLVIVGLNTNNAACGGSATEDIVSFFCFKPITTGTKLILTDNGYARCSAGTWGDSEGTVELTRTGAAIPPGQVVTFRIRGEFQGSGNVTGVAPDANWTCTSLNTGGTVDMNQLGDQLFFMQGGVWSENLGLPAHDATYSGTPLYGFSTTSPGWYTPPPATCGDSQKSGLPLGMNCFSMAPATGTKYNKLYFANILTTSLTQRDWVIAADSPANWPVGMTTCGDYNAASPNWLLAPILNITPGGFTPGLWRGATSTDWFDCKNWDDVEVPLATTNVLIDGTSPNSCVIGLTAGSSAVCASLMQTSASNARNLTIQNNSGLVVSGPITVQRTVAGTAVAFTMANGALPNTLTATNLTVQGPAATQAFFRNEGSLNLVTLSGNLTIGTGGVVDISATLTTGGAIYVGGDYSNQGPTQATLEEAGGSIIFNGTTAQSISTASFQEVFYNLGVDKATNNLTLNNPVAVANVLGLTSGLLNTSATGLLSMRAGSSWTNASPTASFVNGPMEKIGLTPFEFPIGKGTRMRRAGISNITGAATNAFKAEYFPSTAYWWGTARESTIDHVSDCEHWLIDRSSGTPNATIMLSWFAPNSCGVDNPFMNELLVARWDGPRTTGIWRDRGNGGYTGNFADGTIITATTQSLFNANDSTAWTLASTTENNPLPITLVEFTAKPEGSAVRLNWSTASEYQNALFTVERSQYGAEFERVLDVPGSMFSNVLLTYTELDHDPYEGLSYYRLRQTDVDGNFSYSPAVPVLFGGLSDRPLIVFGNSEVITAVHSFPSGSRYALLDMTGRVIAEGSTTMDGRTELNGSNLSRGAYVVRLVHGDRSESARFVY